MQLSAELKSKLDCFFNKLLTSQLDNVEDLAIELDKLSDLAWQQFEDAENEIAPSIRMD